MIGRRLGRYQIEAELGSGGMGVVYRAVDTHLKRNVAIKVLRDAPADDLARGRLVREARAASALSHPHICTIYEVAELDGRSCIVMDHVEGVTLDRIIPPRGLSPELAGRYAMQIADALAHAHDRGVVHRDLKGSNVIVMADGCTKLLDFGLAWRVREAHGPAATESGASLPGEPVVAGTVAYMAPEALQGEPPHPRDDLWALGVLLYEMTTGEHPFRGQTKYQLASAIQRDPPTPLPPRVPAALQAIILRCLAREPVDRYQHAREVRAALEAVQSGAGVAARPRARLLTRRGAIAVAAVAGVTTIGALASRRIEIWPRPVDSIAVLPFVNVGGDPNMDYLSDGVTESVITSLAQLPKEKLKVIALSSVLRYKGRDVDVQAVGSELKVEAILLGRLVQRGAGWSLTVELVSARDRSRLWGEKYDTSVGDLLAVQQEIATRLSAELRLQLTAQERQRLAKRYTDNAEAYQLYLKGRYHWYRFTPEDYEKSLQYYREALRHDSRYALAFAGIAGVHVTMAYEGLVSPREVNRASEAAALKALELDDTLGEAHDALAEVMFAHHWNWSAAEEEFKRAQALSNDPAIRRFYGHFLRAMGRWEEAIAEMQAALALDPISVETSKALGATYFWAGHHEQAIEQYLKTLELEGNHAQTHDLLADAYEARRRYPEALAERRTYLTLEGALEAAEALGTDASEAGYREAMRTLHRHYLAALEQASVSQYVSPMQFALTYVALGEKDQAFAWLEKAYDERAPWLASLKSDPAFDPIRPDPRFAALVKRVGLP